MTDSEVPFIGSSHKDARQRVVAVLSREWPLSAKQVYSAVRKEGDCDITYQAVHKSLGQLVEAGVVSHSAEGYCLSKDWISGLKRFAEALEYRYSEKEPLSLKMPAGSRMVIASRAFQLFRKLMIDRELRLEQDAIYLYGSRMKIFPVYVLAHLANTARSHGFTDLLYKDGRKFGNYWMSKLIAEGKIKNTPEDIVTMGAENLSLSGWGTLYLEEWNSSYSRVQVSMRGSAVAEEYVRLFGKSSHPVCDFLRGLSTGAKSVPLHEPNLEGVETHCIAMGHKECVFQVRKRSDFDLRDKEVLRQIGKKGELLGLGAGKK